MTTSEAPKEVVAAFIAAIERRDVDAAIELLADDCEYDNVPMGKVHGPGVVRSIIEPLLAECLEVEWPVIREAVAGSVVFNERIDRFRRTDGWIELPVTGVWEVHDGRITLWRDYFDETTYREQVAAAASPDGSEDG
jgi:limonene-1,2-epoxide hydrolase